MIKVYCDGACSGNPGPGGWAFVIPELEVELAGYAEDTTNNRMEIMAVLEALKYIWNTQPEAMNEGIEVITDSKYVVNTMTCGWQKKKNVDLWQVLDWYCSNITSIVWTWVKGHADNQFNTHCDELAVREYKRKQALVASEQMPKSKVTETVSVKFETFTEFMWNGHLIRIFKKDIFDPVLNENTLVFLGAVDDTLVLNGKFLTHPEFLTVQNNCIYYAEKVVTK